MKTMKRAAVLVLSCALLLTAVACHQPNETVLTIGDVEIPSGLYLAMQMDSFSSFTSNVQSTLSSGETISTISDALKQSYEDKSSEEWIREQTLEAAKIYAAVLSLFNEFGLEITAEEEDNLAQWVDYYWSEDYQNMQAIMSPMAFPRNPSPSCFAAVPARPRCFSIIMIKTALSQCLTPM